MGDLPSNGLLVHLTYYLGEPEILNKLCENGGACPWGERRVRWRVHIGSRCSPLKGGTSLWEPLILVMPVSAYSHIDLASSKWSNSIEHTGDDIGVIYSLSIFSCHFFYSLIVNLLQSILLLASRIRDNQFAVVGFLSLIVNQHWSIWLLAIHPE